VQVIKLPCCCCGIGADASHNHAIVKLAPSKTLIVQSSHIKPHSPLMSSQPPLSDNPYDNYIKEKLAPPKPEQAARERCANVYVGARCSVWRSFVCMRVAPRGFSPDPPPPPPCSYDALMACLMKSKVFPLSTKTACTRVSTCSNIPHFANWPMKSPMRAAPPHSYTQCAVNGGSLRTCVAAHDLEPECVNLRHMLYQVMPCPPLPPLPPLPDPHGLDCSASARSWTCGRDSRVTAGTSKVSL
jgi:hypothetical protein